MAKASKRVKARAKQLGEKAAQVYLTKVAKGSAAPSAPVYRYAPERGDLYDPDPGVRERSWQEAHGRFLAKSRQTLGSITPGQLAFWQETARFDPHPAVREAMWAAIREAIGGDW